MCCETRKRGRERERELREGKEGKKKDVTIPPLMQHMTYGAHSLSPTNSRMVGMDASPSSRGLFVHRTKKVSSPVSGSMAPAHRVEAHAAQRVVGFAQAANAGLVSSSSGKKKAAKGSSERGVSSMAVATLASEAVDARPAVVQTTGAAAVAAAATSSAPTTPRLAVRTSSLSSLRPKIGAGLTGTGTPRSSAGSAPPPQVIAGLSGSVPRESQHLTSSCSPKCVANVSAEAQRVSVNATFRELQRDYPVFRNNLVARAFAVATSAHEGQQRRNGEPVIVHALETARVLAKLGMDERVVAAGLLHDTLDDTPMTEDLLEMTIRDKDVIELVKGVSKLSDMSQIHRDALFTTEQPENSSERWRSIVLAMSDVRIVIIKLADRLHNMQTLDALPHAKRIRFAAETRTLFAPLASRLGVWSIKAELEDLCFRWLEPDDHAWLSAKMERVGTEDLVDTLENLRAALQKNGIAFEDLSGRPKNLYSIYKKLKTKRMSLDEVYDKCAIRVIVENEDLCYKALEVVHSIWEPLEGKQKDYIKNKKTNGYQSLHSVVRRTQRGDPFEVQVRSSEMHFVAEHGIAAHWRYKESSSREEPDAFIERRIAWARWVLNWQGDEVSETGKTHIPGSSGSPRSELGLGGSPRGAPPSPHVADCEMEFFSAKYPWTDGRPEVRAGEPRDAGVVGVAHKGGMHDPTPVYVVLVNGYDVKVRTMAAGSTMGDLVDLEDADGSYTFTRNNSEEFSYQQPLSTGDVIELVYERQLQDDGYDSDYDRQIDALLYESYNEHEVERERARLTRMFKINNKHKMYDRKSEPLGV